MNDLLIPYLKGHFNLSHYEGMFVQLFFFFGYFVGGLAYYLLSVSSGDPIVKVGYKKAMLGGLALSAIGCFMFYPASVVDSYTFYLAALFLLALGFSVLQFTANPYVANLGRPEASSSRLNLAQAFNSVGTTTAPIIGAFLIFRFFKGEDEIRMPYLIFGALFLLLFVLIAMSKLPKLQEDGAEIPKGLGVLKYRHLVLGAVAIFMYVGGEVAIGSILVDFLILPEINGPTAIDLQALISQHGSEKAAMDVVKEEAGYFLSFYWGSMLVGRFIGAISLAHFQSKTKQYGLMALLSLTAFGVIFAVTGDSTIAIFCLVFLAVNYLVFILGVGRPRQTLGLMSLSVVILLLITVMTTGYTSMWSVLSIGLFNSIMFPTIFTLAIKNLGRYTGQGSSLLVMMIAGGAVIPLLFGKMADIIGIQLTFLLPIVCYLFIAFYGFIGSRAKPQV